MQHKKATYSILKGTWLFFSESKDKELSIHLSNTGMQRIYINSELQSEKRSLKMKSEQSFFAEGHTYSFKTFPSNPQLTSYDCELRINDAFQELAQKSPLRGRIIEGDYHDTGNPGAYLRTLFDIALEDLEYGEMLRKHLRGRI